MRAVATLRNRPSPNRLDRIRAFSEDLSHKVNRSATSKVPPLIRTIAAELGRNARALYRLVNKQGGRKS